MKIAISSQEQDLELIQRVMDGRQDSFTELFNKYSGKINFLFLKKLNNDTVVSQDLVMVTFARAYEKIKQGKYDSNKSGFSTWLYRMGYNILIDYTRTKKNEVLSLENLTSTDSEGEEMGFQLESPQLNPEEELMQKEKCGQIQNFVSNIKNDSMREFAIMRYFDELSYDEIAEMTGKPMGTVKAVLYRAKDDIKAQMKRAKFEDARMLLHLAR